MATKQKQKKVTDSEVNRHQKIMNDFELFCKEYVKIVDNAGEEIPFKWNEQQKQFVKDMTKYNIVLKSRQLGFSTLFLSYALYTILSMKNASVLLLSYNLESCNYLFTRLKEMYESIDEDLKEKGLIPKEIKNNKYELSLENNSRILVKAAGYKSVGRGMTLQFVLLSEFAYYPEEQQQNILTSIEQAMAKNKTSKIVIETTANGFNSFRDIFYKAYNGESKYKAFFFPYHCNAMKRLFKPEIEEAKEWFKANDGKGDDRLREIMIEPMEKELHEKWGISKNLLMWRRWKLTSMSVEDFNQEYPYSVDVAFKSTQKTVFDVQKIVDREAYLLSPLYRQDLKYPLPSILDRYYGMNFFIYKNVKQGEKYFGGVDTAAGVGADFSTVSIYDSSGEQVAVFFSNQVPVYEFARIINEIGRYFDGNKGYAFLCIERNSYGLGVIERLRKEYHYMNLYKQKTFDDRGKKKLELGYMTTRFNKAKLINDFKEQFETGLLLINDNNTLNEMKIYQDFGDRMGNKKGEKNTDDLVIASALACQAMQAGKWYL